jgi:nicotinamidase-related amidase
MACFQEKPSFRAPSFQSQVPAVTLKEALAAPRLNRDMAEAAKPMPNFKSTPGGPNDTPLTFWATWTLDSRPRRIALLLDDAQEEYRSYAAPIIDNMAKLVEVFRAKDCPIMWSSWSRQFDDGISNGMDRWYGLRGLRAEAPENAVYIFEGEHGLAPLTEIAPTAKEVADGWFYHSKMLDMFWVFRPDGKSYLDEKLKAEGVDTVVIVGLWTDECIVSTAYAALSRGYDVIVVGDGVATATAHHEKALTVMNATCGKVISTAELVKYMQTQFVKGKAGAVKGVLWPDGRKDNVPPPPWLTMGCAAKSMALPLATAALVGAALGFALARK